MKLAIEKGTTSKTIQFFVGDSSVSTGAGLTGLVYNTGSLAAYYYREGDASATVINLVTSTLGTWTSSGFIVVDGTNMPGWYQLGIPNALLASGANTLNITLQGAANMSPVNIEIQLDVTVENLSTTAKADVNAEVIDVMRTDTVTEISAVPAANAALHSMVQWLYSMARNKKTTTATTDTLRNDADGADIASNTISDDGTTFTKGEYS